MTEPAPGITILTVIRYPKRFRFFALLAMAVHRVPLACNRNLLFWKLLGSGKNGGFSKTPDWNQWAMLTVQKEATGILGQTANNLLKAVYGKFITTWLVFFKCETMSFLLQPLSAHGKWDTLELFSQLPHRVEADTAVAVLTRATIRLKKLSRFWQHVDAMNALLEQSPGLLYSLSIGEVPFIKQATFSIWQNTEALKNFAYQSPAHARVIKKTREEAWYAEELFVRFSVLKVEGNIHGYPLTMEVSNL